MEFDMPDLTMILIGILVLGVLWILIKLFFKLTVRIFSCGCLLIFVISAFLVLGSFLGFYDPFSQML
jgi:uncharacterized membrane protein YqiK